MREEAGGIRVVPVVAGEVINKEHLVSLADLAGKFFLEESK